MTFKKPETSNVYGLNCKTEQLSTVETFEDMKPKDWTH